MEPCRSAALMRVTMDPSRAQPGEQPQRHERGHRLSDRTARTAAWGLRGELAPARTGGTGRPRTVGLERVGGWVVGPRRLELARGRLRQRGRGKLVIPRRV